MTPLIVGVEVQRKMYDSSLLNHLALPEMSVSRGLREASSER